MNRRLSCTYSISNISILMKWMVWEFKKSKMYHFLAIYICTQDVIELKNLYSHLPSDISYMRKIHKSSYMKSNRLVNSIINTCRVHLKILLCLLVYTVINKDNFGTIQTQINSYSDKLIFASEKSGSTNSCVMKIASLYWLYWVFMDKRDIMYCARLHDFLRVQFRRRSSQLFWLCYYTLIDVYVCVRLCIFFVFV